MPLPRVVARFNKRVTNRFIEPIARRAPGFAVVEHCGRRSERRYETPINRFRLGGDFVVALTYGPSADWVQNVVAGGGAIDIAGVRHVITDVRIVGREVAWPAIPVVVRGALRLLRVREFALITVGDRAAAPPTITT